MSDIIYEIIDLELRGGGGASRYKRANLIVGYALVLKDSLYEEVLQHLSWSLHNGYPVTYIWKNSKSRMIKLHHAVFENANGYIPNWYEGREIDHIDQDRLNNVPSNLRDVTHEENMGNCRRPKKNTSGYTGVSQDKRDGRWKAQMCVHKRRFSLGYHDNPENAARAVNAGFRLYRPGTQIPNPEVE